MNEEALPVEARPQDKSMHPRSTAKHNEEGLSEWQLKAQHQSERGLTRTYKKLHMKMLAPEARQEIVRLYVEEHMSQANIASLYKISTALVGRLVRLNV